MRKHRKYFPNQPGHNRYYFPLRERPATMGIPGNTGATAPNLTDNSLYEETDPLGSWTGIPVDGGEPVQDADDL